MANQPFVPQDTSPVDDTPMPNVSMKDTTDMASGKTDVPPALQKKMDTYITSMMHILHNPKTSGSIIEMLSAGPPEQTIPPTAIQINSEVEKAFKAKGTTPEDSVKLAGAMYLTSDLMEIGNSGNLWDKQLSQDDFAPMFQGILQKYYHEGLRNKTIDPIELQEQAEALFNDKQKEVGSTVQQKLGLPDKPTASMGIDAYTQKKTAPLEAENAQLKQTLSQQQQQAQQQQQGNGGQQ